MYKPCTSFSSLSYKHIVQALYSSFRYKPCTSSVQASFVFIAMSGSQWARVFSMVRLKEIKIVLVHKNVTTERPRQHVTLCKTVDPWNYPIKKKKIKCRLKQWNVLGDMLLDPPRRHLAPPPQLPFCNIRACAILPLLSWNRLIVQIVSYCYFPAVIWASLHVMWQLKWAQSWSMTIMGRSSQKHLVQDRCSLCYS